MKKSFNLTTKMGIRIAQSVIDCNSMWGILPDVVSTVKKIFSPEDAVARQYKEQTDMVMRLMESARDGDELEIEVDDGVMNGISAKLPEFGDITVGTRANGKCRFTLRRKC